MAAIIPTTAGSRILFNNVQGAATARASADLSGLTKNAGDLLICIVGAYQSSAGAGAPSGSVFSGWTAGWTEFCDQMTTNSSTMAIGAAYKWSTGSETGTVGVTQAATITGDATVILLSISGAHASTPPAVGTIANGTSASADPGSLDPSGWATETTMWIAAHFNGMTSGTGAWAGTGSTAPTNYTGLARSSTTDDSTIGRVEGAVAFRITNASAEDAAGFGGTDGSNARNSQVTIAVRPAVVTAASVFPITYGSTTQSETLTNVARISLASGTTPTARTNHTIEVRARVTAGTGKLYAALYEGSTRRSGILSTDLTTSLAAYSLAISDSDAANITSYSDLEVRVWGGSGNGAARVFEVANLYLRTSVAPTVTTAYGAVVLGLTDSFTTQAKIGAKGAVVYSITAGETTVARIHSKTNPTTSAFTLNRTTAAKITAKSSVVFPLTMSITDVGKITRKGAVVLPLTMSFTDSAKMTAKGAVALPLTMGITDVAKTTAKGAVVLPLTLGVTDVGKLTAKAQVVLPLTMNFTDVGRVHFKTNPVALPLSFNSTTAAKMTAKSAIVLPLVFGSTTVAKMTARGQVVLPLVFDFRTDGFVAGKVFGAVSTTLTLSSTTVAHVHAHGQVVLPLSLNETTNGTRYAFGQVLLPLVFDSTTTGSTVGIAFGSTALALSLGATSAGYASAKGSSQIGLLLTLTTAGKIEGELVYLDAVMAGAISGAGNGYIDGRSLGHIADVEPGLLIAEEV